jgi:hypothetical protein
MPGVEYCQWECCGQVWPEAADSDSGCKGLGYAPLAGPGRFSVVSRKNPAGKEAAGFRISSVGATGRQLNFF